MIILLGLSQTSPGSAGKKHSLLKKAKDEFTITKIHSIVKIVLMSVKLLLH